MVHKAGLEPARSEEHKHLKLACLPIPALVHMVRAEGFEPYEPLLAAAFETAMSTNCIHTRI